MTYEEFENLQRSNINVLSDDIVFVRSEKADVSGGKTEKQDIDRCLNGRKPARIAASGLNQETFCYLLNRCGEKLQYLWLPKSRFIEDFSILGDFPKLKFVSVFWNQRATKLWDMSFNKELEALELNDFTRLHTLDGAETAPCLRHLSFGDAVWSTSTLENIHVLQKCSSLESFSFSGKKIDDIDILEFAKLPKLKRLNFPLNAFPTEEIARLMAQAPHLEGRALCPKVVFDDITIIVGKRKPALDSRSDGEKIKAYEEKFYRLIERYKNISD